jgi:dihydroorotase
MKIRIKAARILDTTSPHHDKIMDCLVEDGVITQLGEHIAPSDAHDIEQEGLCISQGWVDFKSSFNDPGFEYRGDLSFGLDEASCGGYTHVGVLPSDSPVCDQKTAVEYKSRKAENHAVTLHPIGAISKGMEGSSLAEMYDMYQAGARWFSDDLLEVNDGLLSRALLYSQSFDGRIIVSLQSRNITPHFDVNEGIASLKTGLKGHPFLSETTALYSAIEIAKYTQRPLHVTGISSRHSIPLLEKAYAEKVPITCDVNVMNLCFNETETLNFDTRFKVNPVLRTEEDRIALVDAVKNNMIHAVVSDHRSFILDEKNIEFDHAAFGSPQIKTVFNALLTHTELSLETLIEVLSIRNRKAFGIEERSIGVGQVADLTLFSPTGSPSPSKSEVQALVPYSLDELKGQVIGTIHRNKATFNLP